MGSFSYIELMTLMKCHRSCHWLSTGIIKLSAAPFFIMSAVVLSGKKDAFGHLILKDFSKRSWLDVGEGKYEIGDGEESEISNGRKPLPLGLERQWEEVCSQSPEGRTTLWELASGVQPLGVSGPHWKKNCRWPHMKYTDTTIADELKRRKKKVCA